MWQSVIAIGGSVLHYTDSLPTPTADVPSSLPDDDSLDTSPGHRRKRAGGPRTSPAHKHSVHEHKFDQEKVPLSTENRCYVRGPQYT